MQTVDFHTHLLNPAVTFERQFDKLAVRFFARRLGAVPQDLLARPFDAYVEALSRAVRTSATVARVCLYPVDARVDRQGRDLHRDRTVCSDTTDVLAVHRRYPDLIIPFMSVNPRRPDALDRIDAYADQGCAGAKFLQNYWAVDPNDEALIPYYEKLKARGLPLVIHVGGEYAIDSFPALERLDVLTLPVATGVTAVAAHMALGRFGHQPRIWRNFTADPATFDADYFTLLEWLETHENLYADLAAILSPLRARALRHLSTQSAVHHKILFGSDYPVPFSVFFTTLDLPWAVRRDLAQIENPFDRYAQVMLEYFPADNPIYRNYRKVLRVAGFDG